jgi:periplasmic protein TonB
VLRRRDLDATGGRRRSSPCRRRAAARARRPRRRCAARLYKGPYFTQFGDFATAGAVKLITKDEFKENFVKAEGGSFQTMRYVLGASPQLGNVKTLFAGQAYYTNGPFIHPENLARYNGEGKMTDQHRVARGAVLRQLVRTQRDTDLEPEGPLLRQARQEPGPASRRHSLHARQSDRRRCRRHVVLLTIRMDLPAPGLRPRAEAPYDWGPSMSERQQRLRLTAALVTSAAIHAATLAFLLWSTRLAELFTGPPETPGAKLIQVSLVSRTGGGGGGPLPGAPALPLEPGAEDRPPPLPAPPSAPKPAPLPRTVVQKAPPVATPSSGAVASLRALAPPPPVHVPAPTTPGGGGVRSRESVATSGTGQGGDGGAAMGGGAGTGDGSGGDGSDALARPAYGSNPKPPYPLAARRLGVEGVVTLDVLVRPDGSPAEVRVRSSSGSPLLDDSAVETVRARWRFVPARRGNVPVESRVSFPIRFKLDAG